MKAMILAALAAAVMAGTANAARLPYYVSRQQVEASIRLEGLQMYGYHLTDVYRVACKGRGRDGGGRYHLWRCTARSAITGKPAVLYVTTYAARGGGWGWIWHL